MGLLGKFRNGLNNIRNGIHQGIQGAKNFAGKVWDATKQGISKAGHFVYENREHIGNALQAASPFIGAINPALGLAAQAGGSFLSKLPGGPVKDKLNQVVEQNPAQSLHKSYETNAQQAVESRRVKRIKKGKIMTQV